MKKLLVTIATPEIFIYCAGFIKNHREYAATHGYEYRLVEKKHWEDLHPSFSKVFEIDKALHQDFEIVLWADMDVVFTNFKVDLADLVLGKKYFMAAYQQGNWTAWKYLCAGLTVWDNCTAAKNFLKEWKERCEIGSPKVEPGKRVIIRHHPWEQWYFDEIIRESRHAGIRGCTAEEIGCFCAEVWHDQTLWTPGMPTLHMAGPATWERRAELLSTIYAAQVIK